MVRKKFNIGCKLKINDPYMRLAADGEPLIKVVDPNKIKFLG
jgi:hypothetical protein